MVVNSGPVSTIPRLPKTLLKESQSAGLGDKGVEERYEAIVGNVYADSAASLLNSLRRSSPTPPSAWVRGPLLSNLFDPSPLHIAPAIVAGILNE